MAIWVTVPVRCLLLHGGWIFVQICRGKFPLSMTYSCGLLWFILFVTHTPFLLFIFLQILTSYPSYLYFAWHLLTTIFHYAYTLSKFSYHTGTLNNYLIGLWIFIYIIFISRRAYFFNYFFIHIRIFVLISSLKVSLLL